MASQSTLAIGLGVGAVVVVGGMGFVLLGPSDREARSGSPIVAGADDVTPEADTPAPTAPTAAVPEGPTVAPTATAAPAPKPTGPKHPTQLVVEDLLIELEAIKRGPQDGGAAMLYAANEQIQAMRELMDRIAALGEEAVPHILAALEETVDAHQKVFLARALVRMATPTSDEALAKIFAAVPNPAVKTGVIMELKTRDDPDASFVMAKLYEGELAAAKSAGENGLPDRGGANRAALLRTLGRLQASEHLGVLSDAARNDPDRSVRATAVDMLSKCEDPLAVAMLERMVTEEKATEVRQSAVVSYARLAKDGAIPVLEGVMSDETTSSRVRASVVYALSQIGGPRAEQMLASIGSYDRDPKIRERAMGTLASLKRNAARAASGGPSVNVGPTGTVPFNPPKPTGAAGEGEGDGGGVPTLPDGSRIGPVTPPGGG